jgi:hypothetical protein
MASPLWVSHKRMILISACGSQQIAVRAEGGFIDRLSMALPVEDQGGATCGCIPQADGFIGAAGGQNLATIDGAKIQAANPGSVVSSAVTNGVHP